MNPRQKYSKVIFLDFDGVIVSRQSEKAANDADRDHFNQHERCLPWVEEIRLKADPSCIGELNRLIQSTGATIVVSSAWRHGLMRAELAETLRVMGCEGIVVGKTRDGSGNERGEQISDWLKARPADSYVVLDDMAVHGHDENFIQTNTHAGLSPQDVDRAIDILGSL